MKFQAPSMLRYCLLCTFLSGPLFINAQSGKADSLFATGDFLAARVAYERNLFSGSLTSDQVNEVLLKKSYCLKATGDFQGAYQTLQRRNETDNKKLTVSLLYESALTSYLNNKSDIALSHLEEIKYYLPDTTSQMFDLLEILALNETHRWKDAQKKFTQYATTYHLPLDSNAYRKILKYNPRNPAKARLMSMFIPGSGQMYAGYFFKGLTSMLINTGLVLFTVYSFGSGFYLSGAFTGVALFYVFYTGGATYAYELAEQKNRKVYTSFNASIKEQLMIGQK